ncbi:MAG: HutD family protein [Bacilli bacterium]
MIIKISKNDYITSIWEGGTTSQVTIFPKTAEVAKQDFIYRISTATVDIDSTFTKYNKYIRYLVSLDNTILLNETKKLKPLEIYNFLGSDLTTSKGKCTDFNLICDEKYACNMEVLILKSKKHVCNYNHYYLYCYKNSDILIDNVMYKISSNDSLAIYKDTFDLEIISGNAILCSVAVKQ